MEYDHIFFTIT